MMLVTGGRWKGGKRISRYDEDVRKQEADRFPLISAEKTWSGGDGERRTAGVCFSVQFATAPDSPLHSLTVSIGLPTLDTRYTLADGPVNPQSHPHWKNGEALPASWPDESIQDGAQ